MSTDHIIIVGAGQAGVITAESLRSGGYTGAITLLGDEPHGPYHRPPLSKAWLAGEITEPQLVMRAPEMLAKKNITLRTTASVAGINRAAQTVRLATGEVLPYTGLVLATGSTPRSLPLPGMDAANVLPLRSRDDASRIAAGLVQCAEHSLPGPLARSSGRRTAARTACMAARPSSGSTARSSTAAALSRAPTTTFAHQCSPYARYT